MKIWPDWFFSSTLAFGICVKLGWKCWFYKYLYQLLLWIHIQLNYTINRIQQWLAVTKASGVLVATRRNANTLRKNTLWKNTLWNVNLKAFENIWHPLCLRILSIGQAGEERNKVEMWKSYNEPTENVTMDQMKMLQ